MSKKELEKLIEKGETQNLEFKLKVNEELGTGTNKIIEWCKKWKLPEHVFEFTGTSLIVTLRKPLAREELSRLGLNERQIRAVRYVEDKGSITNTEYQKLNDTTRFTAARYLAGLVKKGVFLRIGKGKRELKYILVLMQNAAKMQQKSGEEGRAVTHVFR